MQPIDVKFPVQLSDIKFKNIIFKNTTINL